jgi:hypothetical protein
MAEGARDQADEEHVSHLTPVQAIAFAKGQWLTVYSLQEWFLP